MALRAPTLTRPTLTRRVIRPTGLLIALGVLAVCALLSVTVGAKPIPVADVWAALTAYNGTYDHDVIRSLRVPRTVIGIFVGAALGLAGALMQALTRNPLAEPGILGINSGAAAAVVIAVFAFGAGGAAFVWPAFAGAAVAAVVVYALGSRGRSSATPVRLALAGTAVAVVLQGLIYGVIVLNDFVFDRIRFWQVGSLSGRDLDVFWQVAPFLVAGVVLTLCLGPSLNAIALGDDLAATLGARIPLIRAATALAVILLCGAATASAGPIWFVGLIIPHAARVITGPDQRWLLPYAAVLGAILLTAADVVGRIVLPNSELEVGIITAFVGAPLFIALVRSRRMAQL
ncbi:iron chelate uptake ABC transporter family permease subunit [Nocardiopsis sp. CT-R113]|uniref:Iron chelate uptake ABC transporter family permease subunit n=1 Tax=Nocardiopsis codii TaxID=3065942 RepID=A0ABU7KCV1_9ACTN|nr:iron chelate uptake ABC transporter family permease subunit [Nocardiopsis sp. CT-R113]MEE2040060.1 iron chelate uptake ABC transporter family permease subunit [Nocardiopsis sp. CT-R113]